MAKSTSRARKPETETPNDTAPMYSVADILMQWHVARQRLIAVAKTTDDAQTALSALKPEASEDDRNKAETALASAKRAVDDAVATIIDLPELPTGQELLTAVRQAVSPVSVGTGEALILDADRGVDEDDLIRVVVSGPQAGRWRVGHHFTTTAQLLAVSEDTLTRLREDPALAVSAG